MTRTARRIVDDLGRVRLGWTSQPASCWSGRITTNHIAVSEPMFYEEQGFWFCDAVRSDTPDQPVVAVIL